MNCLASTLLTDIPLWVQFIVTCVICATVLFFVHLVEQEAKRMRRVREEEIVEGE